MILIGISSRLDFEGTLHPYLIIIDRDGDIFQSTIRLPHGQKYVQAPAHPLYGDLTKGPDLEQVSKAVKSVTAGSEVSTHIDNARFSLIEGLEATLVDLEISDHGEEAFNQISALRAHSVSKEPA